MDKPARKVVYEHLQLVKWLAVSVWTANQLVSSIRTGTWWKIMPIFNNNNAVSPHFMYCQYLNCLTDRPIRSSDVSLWKSRWNQQWEGGICMIFWPLTLRLCVGGNLGFLRPVRISQAFLSAQESGSAADTTLSFTLRVSLFVSLLNPSGRVL